MAWALGLVGLGGATFFITSLRLASATGSTSMTVLLSASFNMSSYMTYLLRLPWFSLGLFCLSAVVLTFPAMCVACCIYQVRVEVESAEAQLSRGRATGLREPRYWAFCAAFGLCAGGLTWSIGSFNGTVALALYEDRSTV